MILSYMAVPGLRYKPKEYDQHKFLTDFCIVAKVDRSDLESKTRKRPTVEYRHMAMSLIHKNYRIPLSAIGAMFNRDHSTVLNALKQVSTLCEVSDQFNHDYIQIANGVTNKSGQSIKY